MDKADLIITGTVIYTVDSNFTTAEAMAIAKGKILAVGTNDEITGNILPIWFMIWGVKQFIQDLSMRIVIFWDMAWGASSVPILPEHARWLKLWNVCSSITKNSLRCFGSKVAAGIRTIGLKSNFLTKQSWTNFSLTIR